MVNFTLRSSRYHKSKRYRYNNYGNSTNSQLISLFVVLFTIFVCVQQHIYPNSFLNIASGSSMFISNSWNTTSIFYNGYFSLECPTQDLFLGFLDDKPSICVNDFNILNHNEYIKLYGLNNCESHAHHLNKDDEIIIQSMSGVNAYVFSESQYTAFKKRKTLWNTPLVKINNEYRVIIPYDATFYIVIQSTTYLSSTVKLEYTIHRNMYCSDVYVNIHKCEKQIGFLKNIKIPPESTGFLITIPTNNFENKWNEKENTSKIIYNTNNSLICILLTLVCICGLHYLI